MTAEPTFNGTCRCGQINFRLTGRPLVTMACHCKGCQRMTSSAYSISAFYPMAAFELLSGAPVPGALHGPSQHMYCAHCMSWVYTLPEAMDNFVNVRTSMIDNDPFGKPFIETVIDEALPWARLHSAHVFEGFPSRDRFPALISEFLLKSSN